jgi:hypothetical protein
VTPLPFFSVVMYPASSTLAQVRYQVARVSPIRPGSLVKDRSSGRALPAPRGVPGHPPPVVL